MWAFEFWLNDLQSSTATNAWKRDCVRSKSVLHPWSYDLKSWRLFNFFELILHSVPIDVFYFFPLSVPMNSLPLNNFFLSHWTWINAFGTAKWKFWFLYDAFFLLSMHVIDGLLKASSLSERKCSPDETCTILPLHLSHYLLMLRKVAWHLHLLFCRKRLILPLTTIGFVVTFWRTS